MQTVTVYGRTLRYKTIFDTQGEYCYTEFYEGEEEYTHRKYWLFGRKITKKRPKYLFTVYANSANKKLSKSWWKNQISKELELLGREKQIERGELI